jgi:hypothetical protein
MCSFHWQLDIFEIMQKAFLIILLCVLFLSCRENDEPATCAVADPVNDLAWIKQGIKELENTSLVEYSYLVQATYKGETVFYFGSCCPFCKFAIIILDCQGKALSSSISSSDLVDSKVIWKPANSVCTLD